MQVDNSNREKENTKQSQINLASSQFFYNEFKNNQFQFTNNEI